MLRKTLCLVYQENEFSFVREKYQGSDARACHQVLISSAIYIYVPTGEVRCPVVYGFTARTNGRNLKIEIDAPLQTVVP